LINDQKYQIISEDDNAALEIKRKIQERIRAAPSSLSSHLHPDPKRNKPS